MRIAVNLLACHGEFGFRKRPTVIGIELFEDVYHTVFRFLSVTVQFCHRIVLEFVSRLVFVDKDQVFTSEQNAPMHDLIRCRPVTGWPLVRCIRGRLIR